MRILIVCSGNTGQISPFVSEQVDSLKKFGIDFSFFLIRGRGFLGYLKNVTHLNKKISEFKPALIHAHYGLSGLLALLARNGYPLVTTFHGNDINPIHSNEISKPNLNRLFSRITYLFSNYSIFVNKDLALMVKAKQGKYSVIPCHVDLEMFHPISKTEARKLCDLSLTKKYVLFSSSFDNYIKNYPLAQNACRVFENLELIELKGFSRPEVNILLNACDLALITSFNEGSSQFIKEAMACNCPVVATKVGDVDLVIGKTEGCYIATFEVDDVISKIKKALEFVQMKEKTLGRQRIIELELDAEHTNQKIYNVYLKTIKECAVFAE